MNLTSSTFENNGEIPSKYTCEGDGISPPLEISEAPDGVKSFVLIMEDPDVPKELRADGMWDHWIVFNIPADTTKIPEGTEPAGIHGVNTGGGFGYHGPCPPDKEHRYFFKLFALDAELDLPEGSTKAEVLAELDSHLLEKTELMGTYCKEENK